MNFNARIRGSIAGSLIANYGEARNYVIEAADKDAAVTEAIRLGHADGLEHVLVTRCEPIDAV